LLDHCFRIKKTSIAYIQKCAESWSEDEINTLDLAEERIRLITRRGDIEDRLKAAMEIKSAFAPKQKEFIHTWSEEWGFGEDMIMLAYDITLNSTGKLSFPYMNKILESWRSEGITTAAGVQRKQEEYKTKNPSKKSFSARPAANSRGQSSFDVNEIMAQIHNQSEIVSRSETTVNTRELIAQIRAGKG
ncbi:MAG: DnaD domain protein, partial [Oscillospiraceae bacterium]|nr:DnaD domain protein [Oscillospiraceae bacterium]